MKLAAFSLFRASIACSFLMVVNTAYAEDFILNGRLSVRASEQYLQGALGWEHADQYDRLTLTAPFGQGIAAIERTPEAAVLRLPNGREVREAGLDELAARLFSAPLPITRLADWVCGIAPFASLDAEGRPQSLVENDWHVTWLRYDSSNKPQLLTVENDTLFLRLVIDEREIAIQAIKATQTTQPVPLSP